MAQTFPNLSHKELVQIQEKKDYNITLGIMTNIFNNYNAKVNMEQTEPYSSVDANMVVTKNEKKKFYKVEIKERNQKEPITTLPLKVKKYIKIMETVENATPLVIYLCNGKDFYIFDLNKIDLNKVELRNWNIPKVQYSNKHEYEEQPTFFFNIKDSVYTGHYANN